jgi:hypothetical protein
LPDLKPCFVISPIGQPGSEIREHADDVFNFIIKPACERAGFEASRADHDTRPGMITEQMYDSILDSDLLIAVLSFHNPNVFYEIAIAEAAARPLILMIRESEAIPFDVKDRRILPYDLRPRAMRENTHENALLSMILKAVDVTRPRERQVPFRPSLAPLGMRAHGMQVFDRTHALDPATRVELIDAASSTLICRGLAFLNVPMPEAFFGAVRRAVGRGVRPRVLLMDPDNPALEHQLHRHTDDYGRTVRSQIEKSLETWSDVLGGQGEIRLQTRGFIGGMVQANEQKAILTQYSLITATHDLPCLVVHSAHQLYRAALDEFDTVWKHASRPADKLKKRATAAKKPKRVSASRKAVRSARKSRA